MDSSVNIESQQLIFKSYGLFHPIVKALANYVTSLLSYRLGVAFPIITKLRANRLFIASMRGTARILLTSREHRSRIASVSR